jgi:hypothetical protein
MNQWGEENEYERALAKSLRRTERMAKYREKKVIDFEMTATTRDELIEKLEKYQREYPEGGYGTTVWVPLKDGDIWKARVVRGLSCD